MNNSFKELEDAQVRLFDHQRQKRVFDRVEGTLDTLRMFGRIFEMYVPILGDTLMTMGGKDGNSPESPSDDDSEDNDDPLDDESDDDSDPPEDDDQPPTGPDFTIDDPGTR